MELNPDEYYDNLDKIFSEAAPIYDQKIQTNFINVGIREKEVESVLKRYKKGWKVLEIGCGTGEEARKVMKSTGCELTCLDISGGMLNFASSKMDKYGLSDKFIAVKMPASSLGSIKGKFGIVYSFNGALNNEPILPRFFHALVDAVETGGYFIVSVRNRLSLGEVMADIIGLRFRILFGRIKGDVTVEVVGRGVKSHYFYNSEFLKLVPSCFKLEQIRGLGIFATPSFHEKIRMEGARSLLRELETAFADFPPFNRLGDETLFVFQKN
ncbi:MAG: class I SAM-dependent methyltransferase [Thermoplasmatales archaeon]